MEDSEGIFSQLFAVIDPDGPVELALLLKRTGSPLAFWSRNGVAENVVSVMSATLMGSIETLVQAVGRTCPHVVSVETDDRYLFCTRVDHGTMLLLVAPKSAGVSYLRHVARQVLNRMSAAAIRDPAKRSSLIARI